MSFAHEDVEALELVQNVIMKIICRLKGGRWETDAKEKFELQLLNVRWQSSKVKGLLKIMRHMMKSCTKLNKLYKLDHSTEISYAQKL